MPPVLNIRPDTKPVWDGIPVLGTILNKLLGETPEEQIKNQFELPGGAPLVSIYKTPQARRLATQEFLKTAMDMGENMFNSASQFAASYPRIAAHILLRNDTLESGNSLLKGTGTSGTTMVPRGKAHSKIPVILNQDTIDGPSRNLTGTMFHEGKHVADSLGNSKANTLYQFFNVLTGYQHNPFEIAARNAAERNSAAPSVAERFGWKEINTEPDKPTAKYARAEMQAELERSEGQFLNPANRLYNPRYDEQKAAVEEIRKIMREREMLRDPNWPLENPKKPWISRD